MEDQPMVKSPPPVTDASPPSPTCTSTQSTSHSFPPSPPSSCGSQSPSPKPSSQSPCEPIPLIKPISKVEAPPKITLPFSIENILRSDFGPVDKRPSLPPPPIFSPLSRELILRTPPKTPEINYNSDTPVDLSHKKHFIPNLLLPSVPKIPSISLNTSKSISPKVLPEPSLETKSQNQNQSLKRVKYPENPEELANPKLPSEETVWPAWVFCTRYSDRPSSGPRSRRIKRQQRNTDEKRPRTAFTSDQLSRLKVEFETNKYLTEKRRQDLARELGLNESQIKIWFQNKRAKIKKSTGSKSGLAQQLIAQGLYNHSTMAVDEDDPYLN